MSRPFKRLVDGFLFGIGLALALVLVFGAVLLCAAAYVFKRGGDAMSQALSNAQSQEAVEGVYLVSSNLTKGADGVLVSAAITNSTGQDLDTLRLFSTLTGQDGEPLGFQTSTLPLFGARRQTNLTLVFREMADTRSVESLSFGMDVFKDSEAP